MLRESIGEFHFGAINFARFPDLDPLEHTGFFEQLQATLIEVMSGDGRVALVTGEERASVVVSVSWQRKSLHKPIPLTPEI